ncbi:oxidoreductase [Nocardioides sp.]|uniref:oxidoreductase n=1 Tax=Nocardioides sp. TaxID=35761 RepID=UPI002B26CE67|nr:oxidoreductase [Nocardioides sp.]
MTATADLTPRQDGRRFVVTGANSGVGLETARALAAAGATVVLACRSIERGAEAARTLVGDVEVAALDLSDLASVRTFAHQVGDVDVLVNNAGVMGMPFTRSADGIELQFATNHLGHFALTNLLLPRLRDRVVVVSSIAHRKGDLDLDDLDWTRRSYSGFAAYAQSKLANLLFLAELQRRLTAAGSTLRATGAHPGSTATGITGHTGNRWATAVGGWGHGLVGMTPAQGALPTLHAATRDVPGNTYLGPDRLRETRGRPTGVGRSRAALDAELAGALWARSEELSGVRFGWGTS